MIRVKAIELPCKGCGSGYTIVAEVAASDTTSRVVSEAAWRSYREKLITAGDLLAFAEMAS